MSAPQLRSRYFNQPRSSPAAVGDTPIAVDAATFSVVGQTITLNLTWSLSVTQADLQPSASSLILNQSAVLTQADIQFSGQDITLTWVNNWSVAVDFASFDVDGQTVPMDLDIAVTQADIQPVGQEIALNQSWSIVVGKADLQPAGQDVALSFTAGQTLQVEPAEFSISGSVIDLLWTTAVQEQVYSGGWVESAYQKRYAELNDEMRRELEEEQEREELAERLERVLVQDGTLTQAQADLIRLRGLASKYKSDDLPNRARRALAFAERAKSELATKLALREIRRLEEEEEYAVLLLMALD